MTNIEVAIAVIVAILICALFLSWAPRMFDWFLSVEEDERPDWDRPFHPWESK
jgi:hypothetical protein